MPGVPSDAGGGPETVRKVLMYVVQDRELAVFRHRDAPDAGLQVPAGTVRYGEAWADAAMREAREETGLDDLRIVRRLGRERFDFRPFGRDEFHDRCYFQMASDRRLPRAWSHEERHDGLADPTAFDFFWMSLAGAGASLIASQGAMVHRVEVDPAG